VTRVLITAFEPYDRWIENSSWSALMDLTHWYEGAVEITTRRYPVNLAKVSDALRRDLQTNYDLAIHLGQSPGCPVIKLESVGLNILSDGSLITPDGPDAYRSRLPLEQVANRLNDRGIPSERSHHAGTFLCNATLYLSQHFSQSFAMQTQSVFIHIPLTPAQAAKHINERLPSMNTPLASAAIAFVMEELVGVATT
jgi:pyroglutamyl-peptidase